MKCTDCGAEIAPEKDDGVHSYEKDTKGEVTKVICHKAYQERVKKMRIDGGW